MFKLLPTLQLLMMQLIKELGSEEAAKAKIAEMIKDKKLKK